MLTCVVISNIIHHSLDCFWMKGPNTWRGYKDGGSDNVYVKYFNNKCSYDSSTVTVNCST